MVMTTKTDAAGKPKMLQKPAQMNVVSFCSKILQKHKDFPDIRHKMDAIDVAYARFKAKQKNRSLVDGQDPMPGDDMECNVFEHDDVTPPIVVSQVDSYVAYLSEVFLSGTPLFPVVSNPKNRNYAEQLEAIIDSHSSLGAYPRQLLMFIRDGVKYNFSALEVEWDTIDQFNVLADVTSAAGQTVKKQPKKFNRITRLNPRNTIWDWSCNPGDVSEHGDYAGHIKMVSRMKLKRMLNKWNDEHKAYNIDQAMASGSFSSTGMGGPNFYDDPLISHYVPNPNNTNRNAAPDWDEFFEGGGKSRKVPSMRNQYEILTLYARILPSEMSISAPQPNTPQIWKFVVVNDKVMVYAERIISAFDNLPILFGQPLEDGLGYQTQSVAEGEIPFQDAANTLFNIRFAAARRAVADRALYLPDMIKPSDVNSKVPAPKIPVSISALSNKRIADAYQQIPFDMRGTETTISDAGMIVQFSKELHGMNGPRQGSFQKGNKSVQEWTDTMGGSEGRLRLPALTLEHQVFSPLKSMLSLNILQYGEDGVVTSQSSGQDLDVKISELRKAALSFKLADGYTPKSKIAGTDVIVAGMNMIMQSPLLQQRYGVRLPAMFSHFMSLSGAKGFEEYEPTPQEQEAGMATATALEQNNLTGAGATATAPVAGGAQPVI